MINYRLLIIKVEDQFIKLKATYLFSNFQISKFPNSLHVFIDLPEKIIR